MRQMGHDAIAMLVALIAGEEQLDDTHVTLDTTLVVRRSTAAPGAALVTELWRDPTARRRPGRRPGRADDPARRRSPSSSGVWWLDPDAGGMAPMLRESIGPLPPWEEVIADGLGQLTRTFGTAPLEPGEGCGSWPSGSATSMAANRFGIPAQVHEECLTGLAAWRATIYPSPLCWAATFDPELVERMGARIGATMRRLGVHQGLAPVLDVVRDLRWGRVEETLGEDPFLAGLVGSAYVRGLEASGIVATLKHFVGYSASRAARNLAPVSMGPRELADVILPPFEMALRAGRPVGDELLHRHRRGSRRRRPGAADRRCCATARASTGTVVADYFSVAFLQTLHRVAGDLGGGGAARARGRHRHRASRRRTPTGSRCSTRSPPV